MNNKDYIVVASWSAFGDTWHAYSAAICFKAKYPDKKIIFACNEEWLPLFERSEIISAAVDIKKVNRNDPNVIFSSFDIDEKWNANQVLDGYWGPEGWQKIIDSGMKYNFKVEPWEVEFVLEKLKRTEGKKIILFNTRFEQEVKQGASVNYLRNLSLQKQLDIMETASYLRDDIMFVRYLGHKEPDDVDRSCDYIIDVGKEFGILGQAIMMKLADFLIAVQSGVHNFAQAMELPRIMLVPCRDDNMTGYSHPDPCANPAQNQRYLWANKTNGDICSYVKPREDARTVDAVWDNFWYRRKRQFKYRLLEDIQIKDVCSILNYRLDNPDAIGHDMFFENRPMCEYCEMKRDFGKCPLYEYPPVLRNGKIPGQVEGIFEDLDISKKPWSKYFPA